MNIHENTGLVAQFPVFAIDSITYTTYGSVTDQNNNTYLTIVIGSQEWMAENLRATTYANGDPIPNVTGQTQWQNLNSGAWVYYNNNNQYENPYGKLYNWYTVDDPRNVCPNGWHVPTEAEWTILTDFLGGWVTAGGKMKSSGLQYWKTYYGATNTSGFSGLPGGFFQNTFQSLGLGGRWWSSTNYPLSVPGLYGGRYIQLGGNVTTAQISGATLQSGFSVRCVKD